MRQFADLGRRGMGLLIAICMILSLSLISIGVLIQTDSLLESRNVDETKAYLRRVAAAISARNLVVENKSLRSYEVDVGALPSELADLVTQPGAVAACAFSPSTQRSAGWCGPYWNAGFTDETLWVDAWGRTIIYDEGGRRVYSKGSDGGDDSGGDDDIVQTF